MGLFTLLLMLGRSSPDPGIPLVPPSSCHKKERALLPIVRIFVQLANDKAVMGDYRNGAFAKVVGAGAALMAGALSIALVAVTLFGS